MVDPIMMEKAAFAILSLIEERDTLRQERDSAINKIARDEAVRTATGLVSSGTDPERFVDDHLSRGGTLEGIKEAALLFSPAGEDFKPLEKRAGGSEAMEEVADIIFGE